METTWRKLKKIETKLYIVHSYIGDDGLYLLTFISKRSGYEWKFFDTSVELLNGIYNNIIHGNYTPFLIAQLFDEQLIEREYETLVYICEFRNYPTIFTEDE